MTVHLLPHACRRWLPLLATLALSCAATEIRQLTPQSVATVKTPDGRTLTVENLGLPLTPKKALVEFVTALPDGDRIAWGCTEATLEHFLVGYGSRSGLHKLDLTKYFGPHSTAVTLAAHGDSIYMLAGNRGPAIVKYHIPTKTAKELIKYDKNYYYMGFTVDSRGRIYWGTYPETEVIGVDPATDQPFSLGRMTTEPDQSYALLPAADRDDILYVPVGMKRPELYAVNLKTGEKKQILTPEESKIMQQHHRNLPRVVYMEDGKVYCQLGGQIRLCTFDGLKPTERKDVDFGVQALPRNGKQAAPMFNDQEKAEFFDDRGLTLSANGQPRLLPISGLPVAGHELFSLGTIKDGVLYGSGIFPASSFGLDLKTLRSTSYGMISRGGVQNYDLEATPDGILMASYTGGFFDLLDPKQPLKKGVNPKPIGDLVKFQQERPFRLTPDAGGKVFYTGTMPVKNCYGGLIARIDTASGKIDTWRDIVPDQTIMDVIWVPGTRLLFGTSFNSGGTGTKPRAKTAVIFLFDPATGKVVWQDTPAPDASLYQGAAPTADGKIMFCGIIGKKTEWFLFDPATRSIVSRKPLDWASWSYSAKNPVGPDGKNYFINAGSLYEYTPGQEKPLKLFTHPSISRGGYISVAPDGYLYYFDQANLMRVKIF